jgi:hypothetical protein
MKLFTEEQYQAALAKRIGDGYGVFGKPGEPMKATLARAEGARKRRLKSPERRTFPSFTQGMTTAVYVRLYYRDNGLDRGGSGGITDTYPASFLVLPDRPAPFYTGEPVEHEACELEAA